MKKLWMFSMVSVLGTGAALAHAEPPQGQDKGAHHFAELDKNADGAVTRDEFLAGLAQRFDQGDTNKGGKLTKEERTAAFQKHGEERFKAADKNKDNKLTKEELEGPLAHKLERLDTNKDSALTREELAKKFEGHRGHHGHHGEAGPDGDATVTRADMQAHAEKKFEKLDKNGDKKLTADEFKRGPRGGHGDGACEHGGGRGHHDQDDDDA